MMHVRKQGLNVVEKKANAIPLALDGQGKRIKNLSKDFEFLR